MIVDDLKLVQKFKALIARAERDNNVSVVTGFNGIHALTLHEMTPVNMGKPRRSGLGVYWGPSLTGNKFLEAPARELAKDVGQIVRTVYAKGTALLQCLYLGGLRIQREAMKRVMVEQGDLKRSAFTEKE